MNILLIFFALPIATIIISIALQKILKCPALVASIIFAIFLIVTFVINNLDFLIATIVYTILSFITAVIVCTVCRFISNNRMNNQCGCFNNSQEQNCNNNVNALMEISSNIQENNFNDSNNNCCCGSSSNSNCNNTNGVSARINVIPNTNTNGRTGCLCGSYRRR